MTRERIQTRSRGTLTAMAIGCLVLWAATVRADSPAAAEKRVAFWKFDGFLRDRAGAVEDHLTARDGQAAQRDARYVTASDLPGTSSSAVAIGVEPGDAQYLTAPLSQDAELGPSYTIEAWIFPTEVGGWNRLVLNWGQTPQYAYHLAIHNGLASLYHGQSDGSYLFAEGGTVRAGRWYHLAAVAKRNDVDPAASKLIVYVNGARVATATFDGTIGGRGGKQIGVGDSAAIPAGGSRFRGYVDELAIWNCPLSGEEISAHYAQRAKTLQQLEYVRRQRERARRAETFARLEKLGVEEIVFAERGPGRDISGHYYANFGYSCTDPTRWLYSENGGRLCKLSLRTGELTVLLDDAQGAVRDPQVHYDAEKILLSYRKGGTHHYNLYEINTDGSGLRQVTSGSWDDIEPTYLPDGDIIFCSTRCRRWIGCWLAESATLHRCDTAGKNIRMLSSGSFTENTPAMLPDGRVLYTRWEYVNRDPVSFHHLWTINPNGSRQMVYFGNMHPGGVFIDAKPIPGTDEVVLINSPGHGANEHAGYVAVVTGKLGPNARSAMKNISKTAGFRDPCALSEEAFLVARGQQILLMNSAGDTEALYAADKMQVHEPSPIIKRTVERATSPRLDMTRSTGTLILSDIYSGHNMQGVERGAIRKLLILEDLPKPVNFHGGGSQPIGHGVTSTLKRILGTVPVEPDGSAYFEVPAMRSIYLAALDKDGRSVKQMRSFVTLQPGETASCIGCHEQREQTPGNEWSAPRAFARPASQIEPFKDVPAIMDFPRDIQPILDRHCLRCHDAGQRDGGVNLAGDHGPVFSLSYYALLLHWQVKDTSGDPGHGSGRQQGNDKPYTTYSSASALVKKIDGSHHDVDLSPLERRKIRLWIDGGAQYPGTYAAYGTGQIGGCWNNNEPVRVMADNWSTTAAAVDAVERRCGSCHPQQQLPRHVTGRIPLDAWGDMLSWTRPLSRYSRHRLYNLSRPEKSLILAAALSRDAGGYADGKIDPPDSDPRVVQEDRSRPPRPIAHPTVFLDTRDGDYQTILAHIRQARAKLDEIKRFDMPGFKPNEHYVREMKRYGILPASFDLAKHPIDVYAADEAYWRSFWHRPSTTPVNEKAKPKAPTPAIR